MASDPQDAAAKEVLKGLQGIYVRSYTFDKDSAYQQADIDTVRNQLSAPGWSRLVQTRSRKSQANVDIYIYGDEQSSDRSRLIASEAAAVYDREYRWGDRSRQAAQTGRAIRRAQARYRLVEGSVAKYQEIAWSGAGKPGYPGVLLQALDQRVDVARQRGLLRRSSCNGNA